MNTNMNTRVITYSVLITLILVIPYLVRSPYWLGVFVMVGIYILASLGVRLMFLTGQVNVGQMFFVAVGAYTSTLLMMNLGWNFWLCLPLAGIMAAIFGFAIGYPTLRVKGVYYAILSLCLVEVLHIAIGAGDFFGGWGGITGIPAPKLGSIVFSSKVHFYYLIVVLVIIAFIFMDRIDRSSVGRAWRSLAQSDSLAESLGINIIRSKVFACVISSFFAGVAGCFFAVYNGYIAPAYFTAWECIFFLIYVVVGGLKNPFGTIIGAFAIVMLSQLLGAAQSWYPIIYALLLIVTIFLLPNGLISLPEVVRARIVGEKETKQKKEGRNGTIS